MYCFRRRPPSPTTQYSCTDANHSYAHQTLATNALGQVINNTYNYFSGNLTQATDLNGVDTAYSYDDPLNRLTLIRRAAGKSQLESQTLYSYPTPTTIQHHHDKDATSDGLISGKTTYDAFGPVTTFEMDE